VHRERGVVDVRRELVGVPAEQQIAAVGVNRAEYSVGRAELQLVVERVTGESRVV